MSVFEHYLWQKRSAAVKVFFGLLKELFLQTKLSAKAGELFKYF